MTLGHSDADNGCLDLGTGAPPFSAVTAKKRIFREGIVI